MNELALSIGAPWWEVWRLWTAHLVHYGAAHAALNAVAALPPLVLLRGKRLGWLIAAAPLISLGILAFERPDEYRGVSALVVALWLYAGLTEPTRVARVMLVLIVMKLIIESTIRSRRSVWKRRSPRIGLARSRARLPERRRPAGWLAGVPPAPPYRRAKAAGRRLASRRGRRRSERMITPCMSDERPVPDRVKRVAIVLADLDELAVAPLEYLVLYLNNLQAEVEFEFPPVESSDPFLLSLEQGARLEAVAVMDELPRFIERVNAELSRYAEARHVAYQPAERVVVISLATLSGNWYAIARGGYSIIFLGDWEREMAPPSLLEFIVTLVIAEGLITSIWPIHRSLDHLSTRGCIGDFNATLKDVRYKALQGFFCGDCRTFITERAGAEAAIRWQTIFEKKWLGSPSDPHSPASVVAKLGYDLFVTKGLAPTRWQKLSAVLTEDGTKEALKLVAGVVLALFLFLLNIKK
jgi:hypothetical protein